MGMTLLFETITKSTRYAQLVHPFLASAVNDEAAGCNFSEFDRCLMGDIFESDSAAMADRITIPVNT